MMIISSIPSVARSGSGRETVERRRTLTHFLTAKKIRKPSEEKLTDQSTNWRSDLYTEILIGGELLTWSVDITQHRRRDVDGKDIITT